MLRRALVCVTVAVAFLVVGCGGSSTTSSTPPGVAPSITGQPQSETVPLGSQGTLDVFSTGTPPLTYQWSLNGAPVAGATADTFTTPTLTSADAGAQVTVTVTNAYGTATSLPATLTLGPRSPAARDLRFKYLGFPLPLPAVEHTYVLGDENGFTYSESSSDTLATSLEVGTAGICGGSGPNANCTWGYTLFNPPSGTTGFSSDENVDVIANLSSDLATALSTPNLVLTSLDEEPAYNLFADSTEQDTTVTGGYSATFSSVAAASLQNTAEQLAAAGSVITAVSLNASGTLDVIAYTWAGDNGTVYDAQTVLATADNLGSEAASLAASGFILTALGGNGIDNFVLVGTKVHGDTLARPFAWADDTGTYGSSSPNLVAVGYAFASGGNTVLAEQ